MIRRGTFINKIRSLNYSFKGERKRIYLYRKVGGTHFISIPKSDLLEDDFVVSSLRQAGVAEEEIQAFMGSAKS